MASRHPLQRLASPSRSSSLLLHLVGIASFAYSFYLLIIWDNYITGSYGWHFQFLTIIGLTTAFAAFVCGVLADLTLHPALFDAKNALASLATPLEVVISILYWGLHLIDPKLVFPDEFRLELSADIGFHLAPAVLLTLDLLYFSPPWAIPAYGTMSIATALAFLYWYWIELCFSKNGWYPYPIFALLTTPQRVALFIFSAGLFTMSSVALKWLYARINGYEQAAREAHKPLKKVQ